MPAPSLPRVVSRVHNGASCGRGTYAINTALLVIFTDSATHAVPLGDNEKADSMHALLESRNAFEPVFIVGDQIAVVTVQDGPALDHGEIIAPTVGTDAKQPAMFHNSFQDIERFLAAGGRRGRQEQVLVEGTYYINRLFANGGDEGEDNRQDRPCRRRGLLHRATRR